MKATTLKQLAIVSFTFLLMSCGKPSPELIIKECEAFDAAIENCKNH
jgi:hypothetical protein